MIAREVKFLLTHSSIYGLGTVVSQVVSFLLLPLYTRYLTPTDYGVLQTIEVTDGLIGGFVTIGIARALSRFYYDTDDEYARSGVVSTTYGTYFLIALTAVPVLLLLSNPLSSLLLDSENFGKLFRIGFLSLVFGGLTDIGMMYLRLIKKPFLFISITISRLVLLVTLNILFIVYWNMNVEGMLYSALVSNVLFGTLVSTGILWRSKFTFSWSLSGQLLRYSLPLIPTGLGNAAVKQADKYFVLYFLSVADMGIYSLALKIGNSIHNLLTIPFNLAYIPRRFEIMKQEDARQRYSRVFTYYIFLVGTAGLALSMMIPEILRFLVTPKFLGAGNIVPLVVLSMVIFGSQFHFDFGILHAKKTAYLTAISVASGALQIGLNVVLIRSYGFFGAVWSSIISLGVQAALLYAVSKRFYPIQFEFRRIIAFAAIAMVFYFLGAQVQTGVTLVNLAVKCIVLALFITTLVYSRIITPAEFSRVRRFYDEKIKPRLGFRVSVKTT